MNINKKICSKCGEEKDVKEFGKNKKYKSGLAYYCKKCRSKINKQYRLDNPEKVKQATKEWCLEHKEKISLYNKERNLKNPESNRQRAKQWVLDNPKKAKISSRISSNKFYHNHKEICQNRNNICKYNRYQKDIGYRMESICRSRQTQALQGNPKSAHTMELIGCSIEFFQGYLFTKFHDEYPGLTLHLPACDLHHIISCHTFNMAIPEQQFKCFHYTNVKIIPREEHKALHQLEGYK